MRKKENKDEYYPPVTYRRGNFIVTVSRPILTEEERARRMKLISKAAVDLVIATEMAKRQKKQENCPTYGTQVCCKI